MKLSLTLNSGSLAGRTFDLSEGFLTVGRGETCNVRFDPFAEKVASKQHAYIERKPDGFYLTDNQSTNGTFLNGQRIQTARLNSGDTIQFGKNGNTATVSIEGQSVPGFTNQPNANQTPAQNFPSVGNVTNQPTQWRNTFSGIGLNPVAKQPTENQTGKYIGIGLTIFGIVFLSLIVILLMFSSVGIGTAIVASVIAFTPAVFYILPFIWLDRYDPEPLWLLALAFAWGALVSVVVSFIINTILGSLFGEAVGAVVSAPIFEEGSKGLGLILLLIFFRREFDDMLDGIVYAGVIALGFATVENVLYYGRAINEGGSAGLFLLFFMRGILSPFAHVTFTAMTGIGCGIARESHNIIIRLTMPLIGYGMAVFLHALWNGMAVLGGLGGFMLGYLLLEIPFFLIFVGFAFYVMRRQNKILKEMLAIDVARGLIPQEHYEKATSAVKSTGWLLSSLFTNKYKARKRYLRAIGKLGLSYWHIQRATAAQGHTGSFQQNPVLRDEVLKWRDKV